MVLKRVLVLLLFILLLTQGLKYLDYSISEKYETQLEGLNTTEEQVTIAGELKEEIYSAKKIVFWVVVLLLLIFYLFH